MRASSRGQGKSANLGSDHLAVESTASGARSVKSFAAYQEQIRSLIRTAWPESTAKYLAAAGDISVRQAERILARQKSISFELFWSLMESEVHGFRFYWAILDSLTAGWSRKERDDREGLIIERQLQALTERKQQWQARRNGGAA